MNNVRFNLMRIILNYILVISLLSSGLFGSNPSCCTIATDKKISVWASCCKTIAVEKKCCCCAKDEPCACLHSKDEEQEPQKLFQFKRSIKPIQAGIQIVFLKLSKTFQFSFLLLLDRNPLGTVKQVQKILPLLN